MEMLFWQKIDNLCDEHQPITMKYFNDKNIVRYFLKTLIFYRKFIFSLILYPIFEIYVWLKFQSGCMYVFTFIPTYFRYTSLDSKKSERKILNIFLSISF